MLPAFLSATGFGVTGKNAAIHANAVATDLAGNTVVTGSFRGTATFGSTASNASFTSANTEDSFIARYSATGALIWVRTFAGQSTTSTSGPTSTTTFAIGQGSAVAIDSSGNVFIAGSFDGTVNFGTTTNPNLISSPTTTEAFVAKLDGLGNLVWVRNNVASATYDNDPANALGLDRQGGVVIAGTFQDSVAFGSIRLQAVGASEAFVARFDSAGNPTWAVSSQGTAGSNAQATGMAVDSSGSIALTGFYSGSISLGSGTGASAFKANGSDDALTWKLDPSGKFLWGRSFGSTDYDSGNGVAIDSSNNIEVVGTFSGSVNFATGPQPDTLTAGPIFDAYVLKLDPTGQEIWVKGYVGPGGWSKGQAIAVDPFNQAHIAGAFTGSVDFDPGPNVDSLKSVGSTDAFASGLDSQGNFVYATQAGQTNFNASLGVAVNPSGNVALVGTYSGSIAFGPLAVPSVGVANGFVARLQTQPTPIPSSPVLEAGSTTGITNNTSITTPILDVNIADPLNVVLLIRDGVTVAQRVGPGPLPDPGPVSQGVHQYSAVEVSSANVISLPSPSTTVMFFTTPPAAPSMLGLLAADDSGTVGDGLTNIRQTRITGKATAGSTIQILSGSGVVLGSTTAASDGSFVAGLSSLADGSYPLQAVAIDPAANRSQKSAIFNLTILTATPATPTVPTLLVADDTGVRGDSMTSVRRPRINGLATPGDRVDWIAADGSVVGSSFASTVDGSYVIQASKAFPNGAVAVRVRQTDLAGNVGASSASIPLIIRATTGDYFGDSKTDVATFRPSDNTFYIIKPSNYSLYTKAYAAHGDVPISGDFFGDGQGDVAVFRPSTATFFLFDPLTNATYYQAWGTAGDVPVPGDYDGDGKTDIAVFRPSNQTFYVQLSGTNSFYAKAWGAPGDIPVPGDYFGNGHTDVAVFRPSNVTFYFFDPITGAIGSQAWGAPGDIPVPADYDGDGKTDLSVFRPSNQTFYAQLSTTNTLYAKAWGAPGDIPVTGDYFGNGRASWAVYRPSTSTFFANDPVTDAILIKQWGGYSDKPIQPPLAINFNFGSNVNGHAIRVPIGVTIPAQSVNSPVPFTSIVELGSIEPVGSRSRPQAKATTVARAMIELSLERWRKFRLQSLAAFQGENTASSEPE